MRIKGEVAIYCSPDTVPHSQYLIMVPVTFFDMFFSEPTPVEFTATTFVIKTAPYILPDIRLIAQSLMTPMLDATELDAGISII